MADSGGELDAEPCLAERAGQRVGRGSRQHRLGAAELRVPAIGAMRELERAVRTAVEREVATP